MSMMGNDLIPDIVGPYEGERAARTSLDWAKNLAQAVYNTDVNKPKPKAGKSKKTKSPLDIYTQALQKMVQGPVSISEDYRQPYDELTNQLNTMGQQAEGTVGSSMDQLKTFLQGQANPYANFQAQQTQVSPALSSLLQSQGVSTDPLQQYAATVNAQNAGQTTAFQNLANTLRDVYGAQQAGALQDVETNRANLLSQLGASRMGMGTQINQQAVTRRNELMNQATNQRSELMQLLLSALSKGGRLGKGGLG